MVNLVSVMAVVVARARRISVSVGLYPGAPIRRTSVKKLMEVIIRRNNTR